MIQIVMAKSTNGNDMLRTIKTKGRKAIDITDASEIYLVGIKINNQIINTISVETGEIPKRTPAPVAIPFPPLKRKNTVHICPAMTEKPIIALSQSKSTAE